jgi:hypothetical protein
MFCPQCGQQRLSTETSFCSRCGYLLTGTADLLQTGGIIPYAAAPGVSKGLTPRNKGLKQGLFIFLLTFLVVPIVAIFTVAINAPPFAVAISAISLFMGGLLRMAYALMFESNDVGGGGRVLPQSQQVNALPPQYSVPISPDLSRTAGNWRDTNDLHPPSVTEGTTKLLEKEESH